MRIKLFQDGAELPKMIEARAQGVVDGFTTNPTLMRRAGVSDYKEFARRVIAAIPDLPVSFEVFSDAFDMMEREAREIASWGGKRRRPRTKSRLVLSTWSRAKGSSPRRVRPWNWAHAHSTF
jgi:transaldolase